MIPRPPDPARPLRPSRSRLATALVGLATAALLAAACGSDPDPTTVVVLSHDSFEISDELVESFESETGLTLEVRRGGDAVAALNQAILTVDNPQGDVFFGVDEATVSRARDAGLFEPYEAAGLERVPAELRVVDDHFVTPIDHGPVCINYDAEWFDREDIPVPQTLEDLADPTYDGLLVVQNPASSTPGLSFLLATISEYGEDGWLDYWRRLADNDVVVTSGWTDAYYGRFSGPSSEGDRPLVLSYGTSPPFEVTEVDGELPSDAPTGVMESSCIRQVELAGVLSNAANPDGARQLIDFLLTDEFQEQIPMTMYVFPVVDTVELPEIFTRFAVAPSDPHLVDHDLVESERERWISEWTDVVLR